MLCVISEIGGRFHGIHFNPGDGATPVILLLLTVWVPKAASSDGKRKQLILVIIQQHYSNWSKITILTESQEHPGIFEQFKL